MSTEKAGEWQENQCVFQNWSMTAPTDLVNMAIWWKSPCPPCFTGMVRKNLLLSFENTGFWFWGHWILRDSQSASISSLLLAYRYNTHCFKIAAQFGANRAHNSIQIKCYSVEIWIANIMEHLHFSLPVWWARDLKLPHVSEIQVKEYVLDPTWSTTQTTPINPFSREDHLSIDEGKNPPVHRIRRWRHTRWGRTRSGAGWAIEPLHRCCWSTSPYSHSVLWVNVRHIFRCIATTSPGHLNHISEWWLCTCEWNLIKHAQ